MQEHAYAPYVEEQAFQSVNTMNTKTDFHCCRQQLLISTGADEYISFFREQQYML